MGKVSISAGFVGLLVSCVWAEPVLEKNAGLGRDKDFELAGLESRFVGVLRGGRRLLQDSLFGEALLDAATFGLSSRVQELLDVGADPNYVNSDGIATPLIMAAINDKVDVISVLLSAGATVGLRNDAGQTALDYSAIYGSTGAAKALLAAGADPNEFGDNELNPIHRASIGGYTEVIQELVNAGGDISLGTGGTNQFGTALHIAARNGHLGAVRLLLRLGADVNSRNTEYGHSPLHRAAIAGSGSVLLALIKAGADVNQIDADGDSALYFAAYLGHQEAIEVLLESGADKSLAPERGSTPRSVLCKCISAIEIPDDCQLEECGDPSQRLISLLSP